MRRFALFFLLLAVPAAVDAQYRDRATGLVISPPEDFYVQYRDLLAPASLIHCWVALETPDYPWVKMCVERLDRLPPTDEKLTFQWGDRTVKGSRTHVRAGGKDLMQYTALIPLRSGTVRLDVVTPLEGADDAKAYLEQTLASVRDEGRPTSPSRAEDHDGLKRVVKMTAKGGMWLIVIGVGMWIKERRAKRKAAREGNGQAAGAASSRLIS